MNLDLPKKEHRRIVNHQSRLMQEKQRLERMIRIVERRRDGITWREIGELEGISTGRAQDIFKVSVRRAARRLGWV